jgi:hypothetical protein
VQTAKQFQSNDQKYQDNLKGMLRIGRSRQELEMHDRVQQWQEQEQQDHNFWHGAENSSHVKHSTNSVLAGRSVIKGKRN